MSLILSPRRLALAALVAAAGLAVLPATAQESTEAPAQDTQEAPAAGTDLNMGTPEAAADGAGSSYVKDTFDAWELRCVRTQAGAQTEADPCQLYQLLKDGSGNSVAELGLFTLPEGGQAVAGATIIAPLETLLTAGLRIGVDAAQPKVYPFTFCSQVGCVARVGFTAAEVDSFKKGGKATLTIVPAVAPDQTVALEVSLKGFTAGFEAVSAAQAAAQAAAPAEGEAASE